MKNFFNKLRRIPFIGVVFYCIGYPIGGFGMAAIIDGPYPVYIFHSIVTASLLIYTAVQYKRLK